MRKPDFISIGAMKCGTHSIISALNTHPDIFCAHNLRFFHSDRYEKEGLESYLSAFTGREEAVVGEAAGFYAWDSWCEETAERIRRDVPDVKIMYLIRHPLRRVESHWAWGISNGQPWGSINNAVKEVDRLLEMSLYWRQISRYRDFFPDDRIQILFLEDLQERPKAYFRECARFLGVEPSGFDFETASTPKNQTVNRRTDTPLVMKLRQWSGFWSLKKIVPDPLVRLAERLLRRDGKVEPDWDPSVRREIEERLAPDAARILDYAGKPRDFWTFDTLSLRDVPRRDDPEAEPNAA